MFSTLVRALFVKCPAKAVAAASYNQVRDSDAVLGRKSVFWVRRKVNTPSWRGGAANTGKECIIYLAGEQLLMSAPPPANNSVCRAAHRSTRRTSISPQ